MDVHTQKYQVSLENWRKYPHCKWSFSNVRDLIPTAIISESRNKKIGSIFIEANGERFKYPYKHLSGARALATQPRLLVCDEPTSALDVSIQAQILNLLKDLQEQLNLTILFISHDLPVVRQMCDRIGVLKDGQLCEVANTEEIFLKPQHDYTKKLLHLMPKIESIYN